MEEIERKSHHAFDVGLVLVVWLVLSVSLFVVRFQGEVLRVKQEFNALASDLYSEIGDRTALYETSIEGFANLLSTMPELDLHRVRYYVRQQMARYPERGMFFQLEKEELVSAKFFQKGSQILDRQLIGR